MEYARAIYLGGKVISANDKRLNNNSYIEWGLYCPECGEEVHLRHGSIREPYFAHFKQITDTKCSLRVNIDGNNEGRWTELETGRGQRRALFQQHFLALVATNDCNFYIKIAKVKDTINSDILVFLTKEVRSYLVKNTVEIIESSVQLYRNKSNESKFKALHEKIISEAIEYLCVKSSLNVLQQLIYYCISFSEQVIKNDAGDGENTNIVIDLINKVTVVIANTDWTKEIFTLKSHDNLAEHSQARKLNGELRDAKTPNSYLVPSYTALQLIKETVDKSIEAITNRVNKLQIQYDFWVNDAAKQKELVVIKRKLRLNKRLLVVFAGKRDIAGKVILPGLITRLEQLPTNPDELQASFKKLKQQYLYAVKCNMALVKKLDVITCLLNKCNDEKYLNLIASFNPELEQLTQFDLTVINTTSTFRGVDNATVKNGVIKAATGFTGSALITQVREKVNTDTGRIRANLIPDNVTVIDRKSNKEKSQTTFNKALGNLLNLPPTLYRTTSNLYWLLDTSYQGQELVETNKYTNEVKREFKNGIAVNQTTITKRERYYKPGNSGLIAAIRVSKNADYGYFSIGELFVNGHGQISYRLPKKSIVFMLENLAIPFDEVAEGLAKLGLWRKSENSTRYFNGVINRSFQNQLVGGQLDILTDAVLYDLGVEIKRFKDEQGKGTYSVKRLLYPKYSSVESF
ncbi:MAG: competence protein CoiA family protein [Phormidium sp.]